MELNQVSLGIASLTGNRDLNVVVAINQSSSGVLKVSQLHTWSFRETCSSTG